VIECCDAVTLTRMPCEPSARSCALLLRHGRGLKSGIVRAPDLKYGDKISVSGAISEASRNLLGVRHCGNPGGLRHRSEHPGHTGLMRFLEMNDQSGHGR
jgi:hypothetical protein